MDSDVVEMSGSSFVGDRIAFVVAEPRLALKGHQEP
jgi:hypothetical protein